MKRVETIHINGIVFSIEDDAFGKLGAYLDTLSNYFEQEQGGREIIADIEARISELFIERNGNAKQVITLTDVTKVIETLGSPEDIAGTDPDFETENIPPPRPAHQPLKSSRRLYRDPDRRYLGGVCAGLSAWLGINPVFLRLVFVFLVLLPFPRFIFNVYGFHGHGFPCFFVLLYCVLWIIIPKAKTTAQKLGMRGEPVNISNIEKNIRESFSDPTLKHSFRNFLNEFGEFLGKFFSVFGRIIGILLGLCLFCWGIGFAIMLIAMLFMQDIVFNHLVEWDFLSFNELFSHIISPTAYSILLFCAFLIAVLLIFALLYWGVKLMVGSRVRHRLLHVMLIVLWITAMVTVIAVCIAQAKNFAWRNDQIVETQQIKKSDTLYLALSPSKLQLSNNPIDIYFDKNTRCFYGKPNLHVRKSDDGQAQLKINRWSHGESKRTAGQYAENIVYQIELRDSLLIFDAFFTVTPQDKWKFQTLNLELYIPERTVIVADDALCRNFHWRPNADYTWVMTEKNGLKRVDQ